MRNQVSSTRQILEELGIHSFEEYQALVAKWESPNNRKIHNGQEKIDALRQVVVDNYYNFTHQVLLGQYISVNPTDIPSSLYLDNYMCIFPRRTLIETDTLCSFVDLKGTYGGNYDMPPNDFFKQYFRYEKLLNRGIAQLYPVKTDMEQNTGDSAITDSSPIVRLKNVADVSQNGNFSRIVQQANVFYFAFPWLYNASTDVYLEICDRFPAEFEHLAITIEKFSKATQTGTDFHTAVLTDLKEALVNIQIAFDKKRAHLKSKGIAATLGIALTCVPFAVPDFFTHFNPDIFKTVIGGASILGSKDLLSSFMDLRNENIEDPFWVIWKWKNSVVEL